MYLIIAVAVTVLFVLLVVISRLTRRRSGRPESGCYEPRSSSRDYPSASFSPKNSSLLSGVRNSFSLDSSAGRSGGAGARLVERTQTYSGESFTNTESSRRSASTDDVYDSPAPKRAKSVDRDTGRRIAASR